MSVFIVKIIFSNFYFLSLEQQHLVENGLSLNNSTVHQVQRVFSSILNSKIYGIYHWSIDDE